MNAKVRKKDKKKRDFEKGFSKLMSNLDFGKTMGNVRKQRDIKRRENYLVSEPNYHHIMLFPEELTKTQILMNKPV